MTTKRVSMQKIKDILRLKYDANLSLRQIALSLSLSLGVVSQYLKRAEAAGLLWPLPEDCPTIDCWRCCSRDAKRRYRVLSLSQILWRCSRS